MEADFIETKKQMEADFTERKKKLWKQLKPKIEEEVGGKYEVDVDEIYDDSRYFCLMVKLRDSVYLKADCNAYSESYYALKLVFFIGDGRVENLLRVDSFKCAIKKIGKTKIKKRIVRLNEELDEML